MKKSALTTFAFPNGLRIVYRHTPDNPVSAAHLFLTEGAASETAAEKGITTLMWSLFQKGTKKRSGRQIAEDLEAIGAHMSGGANHDASQASCHAIAEYFPQALEIFAEALFEPAHQPDEVEKEKNAHLAAIKSKKENIHSVAQDLLNVRLYNKHPYGTPAIGNEQTVPTLSTRDVTARHKRVVVPNGAILSMASPVALSDMRPLLKRLFGPDQWPKAKTKTPPVEKTDVNIRPQDVKENHPFEQAYLMIGFPAVPVSSNDYVPLKILAVTLGGGMSSRLFQSLREERGLAYDVGSFIAGRKGGSAFVIYMGLQLSKLDEAKREIFRELEKIKKQRISASELSTVKNYFKGSFILDHQTNSQRSYYIGWSLSSGKGLNYEKDFLRRIDKTTPAILQRVAKRYLSRPRITVEIVPK
jgi:predicted Zn-dependent peptidase